MFDMLRFGGSPVALHILVLHVAEGQRRHLHHRRQPLPHRHLTTPHLFSARTQKGTNAAVAHQVDLVRIHFDVDPVAAVAPSRGDLDTRRRRRRRRGRVKSLGVPSSIAGESERDKKHKKGITKCYQHSE